mmetsp:Transcript_63929/g.73334  ORF Transcript_63929/g.73334 Transcript_63929/m.73334 type:complete len:197 (+) Transcript_63929:202-792(+)
MGFGFGPNRKLETCGIKVFFSRYMPSWEPETRQQIKEDNFSAEFDLFSEYDRLLEDPSLRLSEKLKLVDVPSRRRIIKFVSKLMDVYEIRKEILVYAMILLKRFLLISQWSLRATTWRSLVVTSLRLALKTEDDIHFPAEDIHYLYPIFTPAEFVRMNITFLQLIDYRMFVLLEDLSCLALALSAFPLPTFLLVFV